MIVKWFLEALVTPLIWFLDWLPGWSLPNWITTAVNTLTDLAEKVAAFSNFMPIGLIVACLGLLFTTYMIALGIRVGRIVASFFTAGGGSAA